MAKPGFTPVPNNVDPTTERGVPQAFEVGGGEGPAGDEPGGRADVDPGLEEAAEDVEIGPHRVVGAGVRTGREQGVDVVGGRDPHRPVETAQLTGIAADFSAPWA